MRHPAGLGLVVAGSLLLVACGDDGSSTEAEGTDSYVEAVAESMRSDEVFGLGDDAMGCLATVVVDLVGADALADAGVSPEEFADAGSFADLDVDLPGDATGRLSEAFAECGITDLMVDVLVEQLVTGAGEELPLDATTCLENAIDRQELLDSVAVGFIDGSDVDFDVLLFDTLSACPDVMISVMLAGAGLLPIGHREQRRPDQVGVPRSGPRGDPGVRRSRVDRMPRARPTARRAGARGVRSIQLDLAGAHRRPKWLYTLHPPPTRSRR